MNMKNVYKFHDGLFYPPELKYESIPADAIDVSEGEYRKAMGRAPGSTFSVSSDGLVTLIEPAPPTKEQLIITAEAHRIVLRQRADHEIAWRQDAVDAGIATVEETAALSEWKKYRVLLMRVDTAKPVWPTPPGEQAS
ncbi:tail fiber assembly protein [Escherichia coli]|nr:tail fiber assembly protein [Escherichia coli]